MKTTLEELSTLKGSVDDYTQRASTEIEHLATSLGMKPKVEVPKEVEEELKKANHEIDELKHELGLENFVRLSNRLKL